MVFHIQMMNLLTWLKKIYIDNKIFNFNAYRLDMHYFYKINNKNNKL